MSHTATSAAFFLLPGGLSVLGGGVAFIYLSVRARARSRQPAPASAAGEGDMPALAAAELAPFTWDARVLPRPPATPRRPAVTPPQPLALAPLSQDAGDGA
jgi:hypothetical protein